MVDASSPPPTTASADGSAGALRTVRTQRCASTSHTRSVASPPAEARRGGVVGSQVSAPTRPPCAPITRAEGVAGHPVTTTTAEWQPRARVGGWDGDQEAAAAEYL